MSQDQSPCNNILAAAGAKCVPNDDDFHRKIYSPPPAAKRWADMPRFGHPNDLSTIENTNDYEDYARGLYFRSFFVFSLFVLWAVLVLIFMCCGRRRVGFLSGRPFENSSRSTCQKSPKNEEGSQNDSEVSSDMRGERRGQLVHHTIIRSVFVLCGLLFMIFSIVRFGKGSKGFEGAVDTIHEGALDADEVAVTTRDTIKDSLKPSLETSRTVQRYLETELGSDYEFCPRDPTLYDFYSQTKAQRLRREIDNTIRYLDDLGDYAESDLNRLEKAAQRVHNNAKEVADVTEEINIATLPNAIALLVYLIVALVLILSAILSHYDNHFAGLISIINFFVLPLFILLTSLSILGAAVVSIPGVVNSDFCVPPVRPVIGFDGVLRKANSNPDITIYRILDNQGYNSSSYTFKVAQLYISQCQQGTDPFAPIRQNLPKLNSSISVLNDFIESMFIMNGGMASDLASHCGRDYSELQRQALVMNETLAHVNTDIQNLLRNLACEKLAPIYTNTVYEGLCEQSILALYWFYASNLIVGLMGMAMITLRSSVRLTNRNAVVQPPKQLDTDNSEIIVHEFEPKNACVTETTDFPEQYPCGVCAAEEGILQLQPCAVTSPSKSANCTVVVGEDIDIVIEPGEF